MMINTLTFLHFTNTKSIWHTQSYYVMQSNLRCISFIQKMRQAFVPDKIPQRFILSTLT